MKYKKSLNDYNNKNIKSIYIYILKLYKKREGVTK